MDDLLSQAVAAVRGDRVEELRALVDEHPDLLNTRVPPDGGTLLHVAVWERALEVCQLLVEAGATRSSGS